MGLDLPAREGGNPVVSEAPVPFFRSTVSEADIEAVVETLRSGWLTLGPKTHAFESACAERVQAPHAIATNSCTSALFLALHTCGLSPKDEVLVPAMTFASTVNTIRHVGAIPILVDIESESFGLDPKSVERQLTAKSKAIVAVDYAGQPCRLPELQALAEAHGCRVIEDAAHAFGASLNGKPVGAWSDFTAFSFYATKCITTGEGGLLTVREEEEAHRARLLGFHGMERDAWKRYTDRGSWYYELELPGYKFNMTDIQAALGLSQLAREPELRAARTRVAQKYNAAFVDLDHVQVPETRNGVGHAWHLYVLRLKLEGLSIDRDSFALALREEGIVPSVHFLPYHRHPAGRTLPRRDPLTATESFADSCLSLPLFPGMREAESDAVIQAVHKLIHYYKR